MHQKFHLINIESQKLKKLNTFCLQKISKEYFRIKQNKTLTLKSIKKIINDNNTRANQFNTINANSTQTSFNYHNNNKLRAISAHKKLSNSNFNNENDKQITDSNLKLIEALKKNNTSEKLKNYINIDINGLYKHNNKNIINLDRFNNSFRIQMNNTCYKFIPNNHLKKLNELQRDNPLVRK